MAWRHAGVVCVGVSGVDAIACGAVASCLWDDSVCMGCVGVFAVCRYAARSVCVHGLVLV